METVLPIIQIVLSVLLIVGVLMQQSDSGLGSAFGGADEGGLHRTRRGPEKIVFVGTIVIAILFAVTSLLILIL